MSDSGAPKHWPFEVVDPSDFKLPERAVNRVKWFTVEDSKMLKQELVEFLNEKHQMDGWHGVGYHYVIDHVGNIVTGRPLDEVPVVETNERSKTMIAVAFPSTLEAWGSANVLWQCIQETCRLARKKIELVNG